MKTLVFFIIVSITTVRSRPSFPPTPSLSHQPSSHECDYPTLDNQIWRWCYLPLYGRLVGWFYPSPYTYGGGYYYPLTTNSLDTWCSYPYDSNQYSVVFQPYVDVDTTKQTVWQRPITTADHITENNAVNIFVGKPFVGEDDKPSTHKEPETIPDKNEMNVLTSKLINVLETLISTQKEDAENEPPKKTIKTDAMENTITNFQKEVSQEIENTGYDTDGFPAVGGRPQTTKTQIINEDTEKTVHREGMGGVPQGAIETAAQEEPIAVKETDDMKNIPHKSVPEDASQNAPASNVPQSEPHEVETPQMYTPENDAPTKIAPEGYAPQSDGPEKDDPMKVAPESFAPEIYAPQSDGSMKVAPGGHAPEGYAPDSDAPESHAPDNHAPESAVPEKQAPESAAPGSVAPEKQAPESAAPEKQAVAFLRKQWRSS